MKSIATKMLSLVTLLLLAGCTSTPMPDMFANHFSQAAQNPAHGKCMTDNAVFNNRQIMVAPSAVENAWTHCLNQFGIIIPDGEEEEAPELSWGQK
jgi:hypothetical protein